MTAISSLPSLFSPLTVRGVSLAHRIVVSPMCQYSSADGFATDWHLVHLGSRAVGGAAIVTVEGTGITPDGRITPACLGIWKDDHIPKLKQVATFIAAQGSVPAIQLSHAGRKASTLPPGAGGAFLKKSDGGWQHVAPSAIPFRPTDDVPRELNVAELPEIIDAHRKAAIRAVEAGFKIIEIHAAHGYLLNQFMSPLANARTDQYGGSLENRIRLTIETILGIRGVIPADMPLFMKISAIDWAEGGFTVSDSVRLAESAKEAGVDLIICSSGNVVSNQKVEFKPGFNVPFAAQLRRESQIATGVVGLITQAEQADDIISHERADLVYLAREFLRDPYFPLHAAKALGLKLRFPGQYTPAFI